jgi:hypothetical protein
MGGSAVISGRRHGLWLRGGLSTTNFMKRKPPSDTDTLRWSRNSACYAVSPLICYRVSPSLQLDLNLDHLNPVNNLYFFQVKYYFRCVGRVKESFKVRWYLWHFVTRLFHLRRLLVAHPNPRLEDLPDQLAATA